MHHHIRLFFISLILLVLLYLVYKIFSPFLLMVVLGFVIAVVIEPIFRLLETRWHNKHLAGIASVILVIVFVIVPLIFFLTIIFSEAKSLVGSLASHDSLITEFNNRIIEFARGYDLTAAEDSQTFQQYFQKGIEFLASSALKITSSIPKILTGIIIMLMAVYYLLVNRDRIAEYITEINPLTRKETETYYQRAQDLIIATVRGNLVIIVLQGVAGGVGFALFGVGSPVLLGLLYTFASTIPIVGAALVWVPAVVVLFVKGSTMYAILLALWCMLFVGTIDNFLAPKLIQKRAKLHQFFILIGVVGGVSAFGILGLVLGPLLIALLFATVDIAKKIVAENGRSS